MATKKFLSIQITKAFWIDVTGARIYCSASINRFNNRELEITVGRNGEKKWTAILTSDDGFNYDGSFVIKEQEQTLSAQVFTLENGILLIGDWETNKNSGEFVIEGRLG